MNFNNSPDQQIFHQTSSNISDTYLQSSPDVMGAQSDDFIVTPNVELIKKPDSDIACNNVSNYQVRFLLVKLNKKTIFFTKLHI